MSKNGQPQRKSRRHFGMEIGSINVGLCQLVVGVSLICDYSHSLISLVVSLVLSPVVEDRN